MSVMLPPALADIPLAGSYLEALGQHHQVPLLRFSSRLENWAQHVLMQQEANAEIDATRAMAFDFSVPDNLPLSIPVNAVRDEAALAALWQQQGLGKVMPDTLLLPLFAAAWWVALVSEEALEEQPQTPWGRLLQTLFLLRRYAHSIHSLRLLVVALYDMNEAWQQYAEQSMKLVLQPHPQWLRLKDRVTRQEPASELTPEGQKIPARLGLLPAWLTGNWAAYLQDDGLLPSLPNVAKEAVQQLHKEQPLKAIFQQLLEIYQQSLEGLPPLCVSGARVAMEWRLMAEQFKTKDK